LCRPDRRSKCRWEGPKSGRLRGATLWFQFPTLRVCAVFCMIREDTPASTCPCQFTGFSGTRNHGPHEHLNVESYSSPGHDAPCKGPASASMYPWALHLSHSNTKPTAGIVPAGPGRSIGDSTSLKSGMKWSFKGLKRLQTPKTALLGVYSSKDRRIEAFIKFMVGWGLPLKKCLCRPENNESFWGVLTPF